MKKLALSSAIALALGLSSASFANEIDDSFALGNDQAAAQTGGAAAAQRSAAASDSFNSRYDFDLTRTLDVDYDYRSETKLDLGIAVAASVLVGEVSGNSAVDLPLGIANDDINARTVAKPMNSIDDTHTTGISAISQSLGNNNLTQQSAVVQANFHM